MPASLQWQPARAGSLGTINQARVSQAPQAAGNGYRPVVDGRTLPRRPVDPDLSPLSRSIPLMVGSIKGEATGLSGGPEQHD